MDKADRDRRARIFVTILMMLLSAVVLYPFLDAIVLAVFVSYMLRFAHKHVNRYIDSEVLSSTLIMGGVVIGVTAVMYIFVNNFFIILEQVNTFTGSIREGVISIVDFLQLSEQFQDNLRSFLGRISDMLTNYLLDTFSSIPSLLIDVAIFLVTALYLYKDRASIENRFNDIMKNVPQPEKGIIFSVLGSIDDILKGVFVTQFVVAAALGLITAVGFWIIGRLTSPIPLIPLWAILVAIAALLPLVAAFMFYGPMSAYYFMTGAPLKATMILLFGLVVINLMSEIVLRPYVGSKRMDEHPLVIFLGFLAGPITLGIKGIVLGPLLLMLTKQFILSYTHGPSE